MADSERMTAALRAILAECKNERNWEYEGLTWGAVEEIERLCKEALE